MKLKYGVFSIFGGIVVAMVVSDILAQSPSLDLNDPLGRGWFEEERPQGRSSRTLSTIEALAVQDEKETLLKYSKSSPGFENMFTDVVADTRQSLAIVRSKGLSRSPKARKRQIALGTVVSDNGFVLTKASELKGELYCEFANGDIQAAELIGLDIENDMALLKTEADGLQPAIWSDRESSTTGDWVATPLDHDKEIEVGVVSVNARLIEPSLPFIGIFTNEAKPTGVIVVNVQPKSPAEEGGLKPQDVILKLDGQLVKDIADLRKNLEQHDAGDIVTLSILRGEKQKKVKLTLAETDKVSSENTRFNRQNSKGSRLSRRRKNFPLAFQHDTALQASQCGGPIVDLDGRVVGVNVARAGRVSSLAIPTGSVLPIVQRLQTGEYSPVVVNAERIEKVETEIAETELITRELSKKLKRIEQENETVEGTRRGLELAAKDIQKRLDDMIQEAQRQKSQLKDANSELNRLERLMRDLKKDHEQLATGLK